MYECQEGTKYVQGPHIREAFLIFLSFLHGLFEIPYLWCLYAADSTLPQWTSAHNGIFTALNDSH
jgi:hypothetical protein